MQQLLENVWAWRVWKAGAFRGVSFNGTFLVAGEERIVVDPPPLNDWEHEHLADLGAPTHVVVTNANHLRAAPALRDRYGAKLLVPAADGDRIQVDADGTFADGDAIGPLTVVGLADQKTPGESGLHWGERKLLVLGDALIGTPRGGLSLLPAAKYADVVRAREGLRRLTELEVDALVLGDGDPILSGGGTALRAFFEEVPEVSLVASEAGGLEPEEGSDGWYVINLADAPWMGSDRFGTFCNLEGQRGRFRHLGCNVIVVPPGQAACLYHRESREEDFLVLHGECSLLIEEQERPLRAWDFVHCPPGTRHVVVGGDGPSAVLAIGSRDAGTGIHYPVSALAERYGASVAQPTDTPEEAYGSLGLERPQPVAQPWPPEA